MMTASLAFWIKEKKGVELAQSDENFSSELHFNLWSLDYKNKCIPKRLTYLDIGVRLTVKKEELFNKLDTINFYVPFDKQDFTYDSRLAGDVCNSDALISAVFNSSLSKKVPSPKMGFTDIEFAKNNENRGIRFFHQLQEDPSGDNGGVRIIPGDGGPNGKASLITIPFSHFTLNEDLDIYIRFRLKLKPKVQNILVNRYKPFFKTILNDHEVTDIIDFRLNEIRNLPGSVTKHLQKIEHLKKIHFFLIRDSWSEHQMSESPYKRCRVLESDLWGEYVDPEKAHRRKFLDNSMLIYHWATPSKKSSSESEPKGSGIGHFSAFSKFVSKPIKWPQLISVLLLSVLIGFISSYLSNYFWTN